MIIADLVNYRAATGVAVRTVNIFTHKSTISDLISQSLHVFFLIGHRSCDQQIKMSTVISKL